MLEQSEPRLTALVGRAGVILRIVRELNATHAPNAIARTALAHVLSWIPASIGAIVAVDLGGRATPLAASHLMPDVEPHVLATAHAAIEAGTLIGAADTRSNPDIDGPFAGSVFGVPLAGGGIVFGALVLAEPKPSGRPPRLRRTAASALLALMEPIGAALQSSLLLTRAEALSVTDDLTGLHNSRYLDQALHREVKRAARTRRTLSLLFLDLDGFKLINDTYGHLSGSRGLVEVGSIIKGSARETDIVARFGGDEFAVVLPETDAAGAALVAERIGQRIAAHRFLQDVSDDIRLTVSIGTATWPDAAKSPAALLHAADAAMYRVKERGKNGIEAAPALSAT